MYQHGEGLRDIKLYSQPMRVQMGRNYFSRGMGLNSAFRGIISFLSPLLKSGAKFLGSELLKGSSEMLENLDQGKSLKTLFDEQKTKRLNNIKDATISKLKKLQSGENIRSIKRRQMLKNKFITAIGVRKPRSKVKRLVKQKKNKKTKKPKRKVQRRSDIFDY